MPEIKGSPKRESPFPPQKPTKHTNQPESMFTTLSTFFVEKQELWSGTLMAAILLGGQFGIIDNSPVHELTYQVPRSDIPSYSNITIDDENNRHYYRGIQDICIVLYWMLVFTLLRSMIMTYVLFPFAKLTGIKKSYSICRFAEQGWLTIYYSVSFPIGLYVMSKCPHWMNTQHFWVNYPFDHAAMPPIMKWYYLIQMGFWFQQIFVLNIEERRKDFQIMLAHHIVTCLLLTFSYGMSYTRIGNTVLVIMDFADIWLSMAKCMRYLKLEKPAVFVFGFFVLSWIYTRHYLFGIVIWSTYKESFEILPADSWDPEKYSFFTTNIIRGFLLLFGLLQLLLLYWLYLILRIIYNVVFAWDLDDTRSDTEENDEDEGSKQKKE